MTDLETIARLAAENIELRAEIKRIKENSIPIQKIYAGDLSAIIMEAIHENRFN